MKRQKALGFWRLSDRTLMLDKITGFYKGSIDMEMKGALKP